MTPADLAGEYLYDLWNDADHAAKLADMARRAFGAGDYAGAAALIGQAKGPAGRLEIRLRDCERQVVGVWTRAGRGEA